MLRYFRKDRKETLTTIGVTLSYRMRSLSQMLLLPAVTASHNLLDFSRRRRTIPLVFFNRSLRSASRATFVLVSLDSERW